MIKLINEKPYKFPQPGNSLADRYPELIKEWDNEKNTPLTPKMVAPFSNRYAYWKCVKGHSFKAEVSARSGQGTTCPYCSGRLPIKGQTDFATRNPYWASRWDFSRNKDAPDEVTWCSGQKRFFCCEKCKESFEMVISHINRPTKRNYHCPFCNKERLKTGVNDLATLYPELVQFWDQKLNGAKRPDQILAGGQKKYWWKCENGCSHSYQTTIPVRVQCGCPFCSNMRLLLGFNDLESQYPSLTEEWDMEKNQGIKPSEVKRSEEKKYWWICPDCGKSYSMSIRNRKEGHGCRECKNRYGTSFPEQAIYYYVKQFYPDAELHYVENRMELDVFIPSISIGIEYDGSKYHGTPRKQRIDTSINEYFSSRGVKVIRVREKGLPKIDGCRIYPVEVRSSNAEMNIVIKILLENDLCIGREKLDVDIKRDYNFIYAEFRRDQQDKSLVARYPGLVEQQWDYELNYPLLPTMVMPGNNKTDCWWHCSKGHKFKKTTEPMVKAYRNKTFTEGCGECWRAFLKEKGGFGRNHKRNVDKYFTSIN